MLADNLGARSGQCDAVFFHGRQHINDRLQGVAVNEIAVCLAFRAGREEVEKKDGTSKRRKRVALHLVKIQG